MVFKIKFSAEIWNIGVVSVVLLLVYSATNPACALINTTLEDSDSDLTAKLGYFSESIMDLSSMVGALITPLLRSYLGYKMLIAFSSATHAALYIGILALDQFALLLGSTIAGIGMGMIWVVIPNFVTAVSKHENIERNMSYHMFIYNFNGLAGNLLNYFCLDEDTSYITSSARVRYYTACTVVTILATILGGLGTCSMASQSDEEAPEKKLLPDSDGSVKTKLLSDTDDEVGLDKSGVSHESETWEQFLRRLVGFCMKPGVAGLIVSNTYFGVAYTLIVMIPMCISNTFDDRSLIPLMGGMIGIVRLILTGFWDILSRLVGYRALVYSQTTLSVLWITVIFLVFPNESSRSSTADDFPLLEVGEWIIYVIGTLTALSATGLGVLVAVATGKVSRDVESMNGFEPDVVFACTMIVWAVSSAITFAVAPYVNLYTFLLITLMGLIGNHCSYDFALLNFIRNTPAVLSE